MTGRVEHAMRVSCAASLVSLALILACADPGSGFVLDPLPPAGPFTMNLKLGTTVMPTGRGQQSWNSLAQMALGRWNEVGVGPGLDHRFFGTTSNDIVDNLCDKSGVNQVMFIDGGTPRVLCGLNFPAGAVALTVTYHTATQRFESDVFLNVCYTFGAYPGPLTTGPRSPCGDPTVYDIYRILLHEFGHVVGLEHPDQAGQTVQALMNSRVSDLDDLQADDIAGAHAVNWQGSLAETFVRNLYTTILQRTPSQVEVDGWVAYLRSNPQGADTVVQGFLHSPEFAHSHPLNLDEYVALLYNSVLLRPPAAAEVAMWVPAVIERIDRIVPGFVQSPEFQNVLRTTPPASVIQRFYENVLGRSPAAAEVDVWVNALQQPGITWLAVARGFLDSAEYLSGRRTFAERVEVLYRTFLGRTPSTGEVDAWLVGVFANLTDIEMAFTASPEFRTRVAALF